jgi:diamine N-acetyltransferase
MSQLPTVSLCEITLDNWRACVRLRVRPDQEELVAPNALSLAQAKYQTEMVPLGIYAGAQMVGFAMYGVDRSDGSYWIYRVMIDHHHQGKGHGRAGMHALLRRMRELPNCADILISYEPNNTAAEALYLSLGFERTGQIIEGEVVARLTRRNAVGAEEDTEDAEEGRQR